MTVELYLVTEARTGTKTVHLGVSPVQQDDFCRFLIGSGEPGGTRTRDHLIKSQMLYH